MKKIICCIGFSVLGAYSSASSQPLVASSEIGNTSAGASSQAGALTARSAPEPLFEALKARERLWRQHFAPNVVHDPRQVADAPLRVQNPGLFRAPLAKTQQLH